MATAQLGIFLRHVRKVALVGADLTDGQVRSEEFRQTLLDV
jgi:hypothetical protein